MGRGRPARSLWKPVPDSSSEPASVLLPTALLRLDARRSRSVDRVSKRKGRTVVQDRQDHTTPLVASWTWAGCGSVDLIETALERAVTHRDEGIAASSREARERLRHGECSAEVASLFNAYVVSSYNSNIVNIARALGEEVDRGELIPEVAASDLRRLYGQRRHYRVDAWFKRRPSPSVGRAAPVRPRVACVHRGRRDRPRGRRVASRSAGGGSSSDESSGEPEPAERRNARHESSGGGQLP